MQEEIFDDEEKLRELGIYFFSAAESITELKGASMHDVVGLESAKRELSEKFIQPLMRSKTDRSFMPAGGIRLLLEGPRGTGKTLLVKAMAIELNVPFVFANIMELVSCYIGDTEKRITRFFSVLRDYTEKYDCFLPIFFDGFEELAPKQEENQLAEESVPALLRELEQCAASRLIILAATNEIDSIDPAVLSRFDSIYIGLPNLEAREHLWRSKLKSLMEEDASKIDFQELAELSEGFNGRDITHIAKAFCNKLAQRDSGINVLEEEHMDVLRKLIEQKIQ